MARFLNKAVQIWPLTDKATKGHSLETLKEDLYFETDDGEKIIVPSGFTSDGGSVPSLGRWFINPTHNQRAWWLHDWAWEQEREDHYLLLDQALKYDNCPNFKRKLIVLAVKLRGFMTCRNSLWT